MARRFAARIGAIRANWFAAKLPNFHSVRPNRANRFKPRHLKNFGAPKCNSQNKGFSWAVFAQPRKRNFLSAMWLLKLLIPWLVRFLRFSWACLLRLNAGHHFKFLKHVYSIPSSSWIWNLNIFFGKKWLIDQTEHEKKGVCMSKAQSQQKITWASTW